MWNTAVGIKNCKQLFSLRLSFTTQKKQHIQRSALSVAIFWVVNANTGEKSWLQFSIPTGPVAGGEGGVSHRLKSNWIKVNRRGAYKFSCCTVDLAENRPMIVPFRQRPVDLTENRVMIVPFRHRPVDFTKSLLLMFLHWFNFSITYMVDICQPKHPPPPPCGYSTGKATN